MSLFETGNVIEITDPFGLVAAIIRPTRTVIPVRNPTR
jgi:hypothetical protein